MSTTRQQSIRDGRYMGILNEFQEKINHISEIIIDRRAVPFLGAGVSLCAVHEDSNQSSGSHLQNTVCMCKRVCRNITKQLDHPSSKSIPLTMLERLYKGAKRNTENGLGLSEACEVAFTHEANDKAGRHSKKLISDVLRIEEFSRLLPTPAHRYIAFLAREGLVGEVFTTNYDCCMERAYRESFLDETKEAVNQVHDGHTYRCRVGRRPSFRSNNGNLEYLRLMVYKLNGCAAALRDGDSDCKTILLTERQLQDWRERQWAHDIFRDRLRSRSLIFSGFGSPEPQIRHTVVQILEEMNPSNSKESDGEDVRAPYVVCYDSKKEPSFHQWQIADAFCQSDSNVNGYSTSDLLITSPDNQCLSADKFWGIIYHQVALSLLQRLIDPRTEVADRLKILLNGNEMILEEIAAKLKHCSSGGDGQDEKAPYILQWQNDHETTLLARWLYLLDGADHPPLEKKGLYLAIQDHRVLVADLLLLWGAYIGDEAHAPTEARIFEEESEIGLRLRISEQGTMLYLTGAGRCENNSLIWEKGCATAQKLALLILGSKRPGIDSALVRPRQNCSNGLISFEDRILVRLYLSDILQAMSESPPHSLGELRKLLETIAITPTVFFRAGQPNLHSRLDPVSN